MKIASVQASGHKHIFFVHSHITLICAIGIIHAEGLPGADAW